MPNGRNRQIAISLYGHTPHLDGTEETVSTTVPAPTMDLPAYLEQLRTQRGVSKRAFALDLGIGHAIYVKMTNGYPHAATFDTLQAIAHALNMPLAAVLTLASIDLGIPETVLMAAADPLALQLLNRLYQIPPAQRSAQVARWLDDMA
jgi:transcriptional regulator with XRE-family HTH domain